jgi:hypothetical protein
VERPPPVAIGPQLSFQTASLLPPGVQDQYAAERLPSALNGTSDVGFQVQPDCTWVPPTDVTYGDVFG